MGLVQTVFRALESFNLVITPHNLGIGYMLMNQKARIDLTLLSSEHIFHKFKDGSLEGNFSYRLLSLT